MKFRISKIPQSINELIKKIKRENSTYWKTKIAVILKRDHAVLVSESKVDKVILEVDKIQHSLSVKGGVLI